MKHSTSTLRWLSILIISVITSSNLSGFGKTDFLSAKEIMQQVRKRHSSNAELGMVTISILDADGNVSVRKAISIFDPAPDGKGYKSLFRYTSPQTLYGVTLITTENPDGSIEQELYRPKGGFSNVSNSRLRNHIGQSPFEFEDLAQENPAHYDYSRLLDETVDGIPCYQIMASPLHKGKEKDAKTETRILYIARSNFDIIKVQFFDAEGNITRIFEGYDFSEGDTALNPDRGIMDDRKDKIIATVVINQRNRTPQLPKDLFTNTFIENWGPEEDKKILNENMSVNEDSSNKDKTPPSTREIIEKLVSNTIKNSELGLLRINTIDQQGVMIQRKGISVFKKLPGNHAYESLIHYVSPKNISGVTIMTQKEEGASAKQTIYIPQKGFIEASGKRLKDFFPNSPFEFEDLIYEDPDRYTYKQLEDTSINGVPCYVIQATPEEEGQKNLIHYAYRTLYISKLTYALVKLQFYDKSGSLLRVFEAYDLSEKPTTLIPDRGVMVDKQDHVSSIVTVVYRKENPKLPSDMFSRKFIEKWDEKTNDRLLEANSITIKSKN